MTIQRTGNEKKLAIALEGRLDTVTAPELEAALDGKQIQPVII